MDGNLVHIFDQSKPPNYTTPVDTVSGSGARPLPSAACIRAAVRRCPDGSDNTKSPFGRMAFK